MLLDWADYDEESKGLDGPITVAKIQYYEEGNAESGLLTMMRFMAGAQGLPQPEPSPAGWYWTATVEARGVWSRQQRAESREAAKQAVEAALTQAGSLRKPGW